MSATDGKIGPFYRIVEHGEPFEEWVERSGQNLGLTGRDLLAHTFPLAYADEEHTEYAWTKFMAGLAELLDVVARVVRPGYGTGNVPARHPGWLSHASMPHQENKRYERWNKLAGPHVCPIEWLPILSQWAGIPPRQYHTMTEQDVRELIGPHAPGMWRGTRAGLIWSIKRFLTEGSPVFFEERAVAGVPPIHQPYLLRVFVFGYSIGMGMRQTWGEVHEHPYTWGELQEAAELIPEGLTYVNWFAVTRQAPFDPIRIERQLRAQKPAGLELRFEVRFGQTYGMLRDRIQSDDPELGPDRGHDDPGEPFTYRTVRYHYRNYAEVRDDQPTGTD